MNQKVYRALSEWRQGLLERRLPAPPDSDLQRIAEAGYGWPDTSLEPVTEAYRQNIGELQTQVRFGVHDPLLQATADIWIARPGLAESDRGVGAAAPQPVSQPVPQPPASNAAPVRPAAVAATPAETDEDRRNAMLAELEAFIQEKRRFAPADHPIRSIQMSRLRNLTIADPRLARMIQSLRLQDFADEITAIVNRASSKKAAAPGEASASPDRPANATQPSPTAAAAETQSNALPATFDRADFAPYDYTGPEYDPLQLRASVTPEKNVQISWSRRPEDTAAVQIYRVVVDDEYPPYSPDSGRLVAATVALEVEDTEPFTGPLRHVTVWCNSGDTEAEALRAQPYLHAKRTVVAPVRDFELREDAGNVIGEWDVFPGVRRVHVYRVPAEQASAHNRTGFRILADEENLTGFVDTEAQRGRRYIYQGVVEVVDENGEVHLSTPVTRDHQVSVVLEPVHDLTVELTGESGSHFDLAWTPPPIGRVEIYRTQVEPVAGIEDAAIERARLAAARLSEDDRLAYPASALSGGRNGMRRVPWPPGWTRAYFTPVTVHEAMAHVGTTVAQTRVPPVVDPFLRERVNEQVLTFSWPSGAASVGVYVGVRGAPAVAPAELREDQLPNYSIDRVTWDRDGGLHFIPELPLDGCNLHIYSVAFQDGVAHLGAPVTLPYSGLRRIRYSVGFKRSIFGGKVTSVQLKLRSDSALNPPLDFALVYHPDRFPLCLEDGTPLELKSAATDGPGSYAVAETLTDAWTEPGWTADVGHLNATPDAPHFLRLFVRIPATAGSLRLSQIAILDPPIENLRLAT